MPIFDRLFKQNSNTNALLELLDTVKPFTSNPGNIPEKLNSQLGKALQAFVTKNPSKEDLLQIANKMISISPFWSKDFSVWWKNHLRAIPLPIKESLMESTNLNILMLLNPQNAYETAHEILQTEIKNTKQTWSRYWEYLSTTLDKLEVVQEYPIKGKTPSIYTPKLWDLKKTEISLWDESTELRKPIITIDDGNLGKDELINMVIKKFIKRDDVDTIIMGFTTSNDPVPCVYNDHIAYLNSEYLNKLFIFRLAENQFRIGEEEGGSRNWTV